jgi:hypothetical protein
MSERGLEEAHMMRIASRLTLTALLVIGCSGTQPLGTRAPETTPTAAATPTSASTATATATPTEAPTPRPTATRKPSAGASKGEPILLTWASSGYVTAQVIVPVYNTGDTYIELDEFDSSFTIYDPDGSVTETDRFDAAAPKILAPGGTSYLVGETFGDDHPRSAYDRVEADGYFGEVDPPTDIILVAENIRVRRHSLGGVEVTGEIRNLGSERSENADVVALFLDANGQPLGFARGYVENVEPDGTRAFQIDSSFAEIRLADIAETLVFASDWGF